MKSFGALGYVTLTVAAAVCITAFGHNAWAQTDAQKKTAKEYGEQARRLFDVGQYPQAIESYQKAYLHVEDPVFLFNIGQSYRLNNQPEEAIRFYKNYLRRSPDAINRSEVEKRIVELQREVDKKARAPQPPVEPPAPVAKTPSPAPVQPPATRPDSPAADVNAAPAASAPEPSSWRRTGIILVGVGGGLILTSVVTGVLANKAARDLEKATVFDPDVESRGRALNGIAVFAGLLGVVAGVAGGYLVWTADSPPSNDVATVPRVALNPVIGSEYTGAHASLSF